MKTGLAKSDLPEPRRRFVELMQTLNFGRFEQLPIRNGEPVLDPPPRIIREFKFGGENGPRPELAASDFLLKGQVVDLFRHFAQLSTVMIEVLEIKNGLPFRMLVVEPLSSPSESIPGPLFTITRPLAGRTAEAIVGLPNRHPASPPLARGVKLCRFVGPTTPLPGRGSNPCPRTPITRSIHPFGI